ncbi:hypothetical protein DFH09DRAFT_1121928 [Mycena vulgaris]|nr:hypothetical protein DFH09DRAFT_1121928 [Mycena vulgaris]
MGHPLRDAEFYAEDGDCVVRVGDGTLVKIVRAVFSQHSTAFRDYFRSREGRILGRSDDSPVRLDGETPGDFRAMCRVFELSPCELQLLLHHDFSSLPHLHSLLAMLQKYRCKAYADWAAAAIRQHDTPWTRTSDAALHNKLGPTVLSVQAHSDGKSSTSKNSLHRRAPRILQLIWSVFSLQY